MNDETKKKINIYIPILELINDFIVNIISLSIGKGELSDIINNLLEIYEHSKNEELLSYWIKYFEIEEKTFKGYLVSNNRVKGGQIGKYIPKIFSISMSDNIELELINNIIQYFLDKIPIEITKICNHLMNLFIIK